MFLPKEDFSPEGTAVHSQGREPLERLQFDVPSPVRGAGNYGFFRPLRGFWDLGLSSRG
jgi:hypothetical protein